MWLRNPKFLHYTKDLHRQIVAFHSQLPSLPEEVEIAGRVIKLDQSKWPEYRDADEDAIKRMWIDQIGSAAQIAEILLKMRWGFLFSEKPVFITTDNPVITMTPGLKFKGLRDPTTTLLFPVSPTRVLFMDNRLGEPDGHYYPAIDPPSVNSMFWRESIDHMFSSRHPDEVCWEMDASARRMGFG